MSVEDRTQALLDLVEADRRTQVDAILGDARAEVAALLAQAHRGARARMRQAFADERRQRDERVHAADANLKTCHRLNVRQRSTALLDEAWRRLPDALYALWRTPGARGAWVAHIVAQARSALPAQGWRIDHASDWPATEQRELATRLAGDGIAQPSFFPDHALPAGLRIASGGTVIDGTPHGLLRDRAGNGARLLAYLDASVAAP
jgi:hypothetical protein